MPAPVRLSPEELARLDTSITNFLNNYTVPSLEHLQDRHPPRTPSEAVGGGLTAGRLVSAVPVTPYSLASASTRPFPPTPPQSSPGNDGPFKTGPGLLPPTTAMPSGNKSMALDSELRRLYEERIVVMRKNEAEKVRQLTEEHQTALTRARSEAELAIRQCDELRKTRDESERALRAEIARLQDDFARLGQNERNRGTIGAPGATTTSANGHANCVGRQDHERQIARLIADFDRERRASARILHSKVRAQLALAMPRLRERLSAQANASAEAAIARCREACRRTVAKAREEAESERRVAIRAAREEAEARFREWQGRAREKLRLRVLQARNEAERAVLERLGRQ